MSASGPGGATRVIDGVETFAWGDGRTWLYVPDRPTLERDESGAARLQIIEAGPVAFVQATLRLALPDRDRERLLAVLQADDPTVADLVPAPISVERLALEVWTGSWVAVAEGLGSGSAPWNAALGATLGADATAAIKAALAGEPGAARLVARFAVGGTAGSVLQATATAEAGAQTTEAGLFIAVSADLDASVEASPSISREVTADLADSFPAADQPRPIT